MPTYDASMQVNFLSSSLSISSSSSTESIASAAENLTAFEAKASMLSANLTASSNSLQALRPKDLAEKIPDGVFAPNSFQVRVNGVARDGTHGYGNTAEQTYRMYVHLFFGKQKKHYEQ